MWYICTKECYSAVRNNAIIKFAGKGMEIEKKSSRVRQFRHRKTNTIYSHFYMVISCKVRIIMLTSTVSERLSNREDSRGTRGSLSEAEI